MKKSEARSILGVKFSDTTDDIKAAYRNSCKVNHPDVGGDRLIFEQIQIAYKRLTTDSIDPEYGRAYSELLTAYTIVIDQVKNPEQVDIAFRAKEVIKKGIDNVNANIDTLKNIRLKYEIILKRLKCKETNAVANMLITKLEDIESTIEDNMLKVTTLELSLALSDKYSYDYNKPDNNFGGMTWQLLG